MGRWTGDCVGVSLCVDEGVFSVLVEMQNVGLTRTII